MMAMSGPPVNSTSHSLLLLLLLGIFIVLVMQMYAEVPFTSALTSRLPNSAAAAAVAVAVAADIGHRQHYDPRDDESDGAMALLCPPLLFFHFNCPLQSLQLLLLLFPQLVLTLLLLLLL